MQDKAFSFFFFKQCGLYDERLATPLANQLSSIAIVSYYLYVQQSG